MDKSEFLKLETFANISANYLVEYVPNTIKEYVNPKVKTALLIIPPLGMYDIMPIVQDHFKSSAINLVFAKTEVENVKEYLRQTEFIQKYLEKLTVSVSNVF